MPSPTGIATDPALTSYGVKQAEELSVLADTLSPKVSRIYTSPFYRCIQTIAPFASRVVPHVPIIVDQGLGDWYGKADFEHPLPADLNTLSRFFPGLVEKTSFVVSRNGEGLEELHERVAYVMARIVADADAACTSDQPEAIVVSTHAAVLIALGRALTGRVPEDRNEKDFDTFTCSVSTYKRRKRAEHEDLQIWTPGNAVPEFEWREHGIGGGWDCTVNAAVDHLANGGERNWYTYAGWSTAG